jgi:TPP-dependent pyruvate/acetoin dehydrogenase alpha subunit
MSISAIGAAVSASTGRPAGRNQASAASSPVEEFLHYARMSPAERMRDAILKELGLSEDDVRNMDAATRAKVEEAIRQKVREKISQSTEAQTGVVVDFTA